MKRHLKNPIISTDGENQRQPIGFRVPGSRDAEAMQPLYYPAYSEFSEFSNPRSEMESLCLTICENYLTKRTNNCYMEGANKEFLAQMEKVWIKFYDKIV